MFGLFKKSIAETAWEKAYRGVVTQARSPVFYTRDEVPDTPDGRFDMIMLTAFLVMDRLRHEDQAAQDFSQAMFDAMFKDMDRNLREMGIGDVGIPHRIKGMAQAFFGRIKVYQEGLDSDSTGVLVDALARNLYRGTEPAPEAVARMASFMRRARTHLAAVSTDQIMLGDVSFPSPEDTTA